MAITFGKIISLLIAVAYVSAAIAINGFTVNALVICVYVVLVLGLIWFPEEAGDHFNESAYGHGDINKRSPGILVSFMGWFLLIGLPVIISILGVALR
jgi:hypothetical protein